MTADIKEFDSGNETSQHRVWVTVPFQVQIAPITPNLAPTRSMTQIASTAGWSCLRHSTMHNTTLPIVRGRES
jgi:hypothetical protein